MRPTEDAAFRLRNGPKTQEVGITAGWGNGRGEKT